MSAPNTFNGKVMWTVCLENSKQLTAKQNPRRPTREPSFQEVCFVTSLWLFKKYASEGRLCPLCCGTECRKAQFGECFGHSAVVCPTEVDYKARLSLWSWIDEHQKPSQRLEVSWTFFVNPKASGSEQVWALRSIRWWCFCINWTNHVLPASVKRNRLL